MRCNRTGVMIPASCNDTGITILQVRLLRSCNTRIKNMLRHSDTRMMMLVLLRRMSHDSSVAATKIMTLVSYQHKRHDYCALQCHRTRDLRAVPIQASLFLRRADTSIMMLVLLRHKNHEPRVITTRKSHDSCVVTTQTQS